MTWGAYFFYYRCKNCGKKFKYNIDLISVMGDTFGKCPLCGEFSPIVREGAVSEDDLEYEEID